MALLPSTRPTSSVLGSQLGFGLVSTWMGDCLGIPVAVSFFSISLHKQGMQSIAEGFSEACHDIKPLHFWRKHIEVSKNTSSTKRLNIFLRLAALLFKAVSPPKKQRPLHREGKKAYSTWYSQAVSHPSTNQARPALDQIRWDRMRSGWYGRKRRQSRQIHYLYTFSGSVLIASLYLWAGKH